MTQDAKTAEARALREDGLLTLGVVATDDEGQVLGYAAFSPVTLQGEDRNWVALAPLAVDASVCSQGIEKQLVYEGLDSLNEFSYSVVVVLGDPQFYNPLGFNNRRHVTACTAAGTAAKRRFRCINWLTMRSVGRKG